MVRSNCPIAPFAAVRCEAMYRKCRLVWLLRMAPHTAMPTAPPRLRIMLKRPLAYLSRSGGKLPRPRFTAGATANTCGKPRSTCGISSWSAPQSWVMKLNDDSETREAEHHQPAGVDLAGERHINRHPGKRSSPRRKDRDAGLPGA